MSAAVEGLWQLTGLFASLAVLRLGLTGAPVKRQIFNLCRAQSSFLACCSWYLFVVLRGNCWCLQNQIGVWSPPMSSDSWNTECMPLGDLYVFSGVECVAVELNSGPLWLCWGRCCCRVEALAAFLNPNGNIRKWIIFLPFCISKRIAWVNICFLCLVQLLNAEKIHRNEII